MNFKTKENIYVWQFNSRSGNMLDFIQYVTVDDIEPRLVIELNGQKYGHMFIEILLNSNFSILKSRKCDDSNDFTCITSRGH